jgi:mannitol/fructose-specific phosphotransferase system IIA component (Ntr-type)
MSKIAGREARGSVPPAAATPTPLFHPERFLPRLSAQSKDEVLATMVAALFSRGAVISPTVVLAALAERESFAPTALGKGVAIPHCRSVMVRRLAAVFARLDPPIPFGAEDGEAVSLVFLVVAPPSAPAGEYLQAMATIARLAKEDATREALRTVQTFDAFLELLEQEPHHAP